MWHFIFIIAFQSIFNYVIFPFQKKNNFEFSSKYFLFNDLYINISIGTPKQNIIAVIEDHERGLYIPNILINGNYNENMSNSFIEELSKEDKKPPKIFNYKGNKLIIKKAKENIYLNNGTIFKISIFSIIVFNNI